ncbi:hypothetical protein PROFUN_00119 [Planoprotostelium fungivorum]|uniref:Adenylate/guanylate cyclase n=1 Tax=Planoprotostelium fungivorum TaxID=1890364 RepID=A0A2P6P0Q8_9EUKA|nr:hypothetical protein PROFUN_00119 [Planoprotostelium fungivorum]
MNRLEKEGNSQKEKEDLGVLAPFAEELQLTHMWIDITGFTSLAERLNQKYSAAEGEEILTNVLNEYFTAINSIIESHHGCIFKIAGDAVSVVWNDSACSQYPLPHANFLAALDCACSIQKRLHNYRPLCAQNIELSCRISVGVGMGDFLLVGGVSHKYETVLHGDPLRQTTEGSKVGVSGEIILSPESFRLIKEMEMNAEGIFSEKSEGYVQFHYGRVPIHHRFQRTKHPIRNLSRTLIIPEDNPYGTHRTKKVLEQLVPQFVCDRLKSTTSYWHSELRQVSVVFILLDGIVKASENDHDRARWSRTMTTDSLLGEYVHEPITDDSELLGKIQDVFLEIQRTVLDAGGTIRQFILDDKGPVCIAVFGMPAQGDDTHRSVVSSMRIHQWLTRHDVDHSIGITTGRAFCGYVGTKNRRELGIVGDIVNLSARLMEAARSEGSGTIFCDAQTCHNSRELIHFRETEAIRVKGKARMIRVFIPTNVVSPGQILSTKKPSVGRRKETEKIQRMFKEYVEEGQRGTLVIRGDKGMGKTHLIQEFLQFSREYTSSMPAGSLRPIILNGTAHSFEQNSHLFGMRQIVRSMLDQFFPRVYAFLKVHFPALGTSPDPRRRSVPLSLLYQKTGSQLEMTAEYGEAVTKSLHSMNNILGDEEKVEDMTEDITNQLVTVFYELFERLSQTRKIIVIVEDVQWMDRSSWSLLTKMNKKLKLMIVMSVRSVPKQMDHIPSLHSCHVLQLAKLSPEELGEILADIFDVNDISDDVTQGNPYFAVELFKNMVERRQIVIFDKLLSPLQHPNGNALTVCRFSITTTSQNSPSQNPELPATLEGAVTARIDHLAPNQLEVLKAASIIGNTFTVDMLRGMLPQSNTVNEEIEKMKDQDIIVASPSLKNGEQTYSFRHMTVQEVVYRMTSFSQKRNLKEKLKSVKNRMWGSSNPSIKLTVTLVKLDVKSASHGILKAGAEHNHSNPTQPMSGPSSYSSLISEYDGPMSPYQKPMHGYLVVKVIEAEGLSGRVQNPYVKVGFSVYVRTKSVKTESPNPVWNEIMEWRDITVEPGYQLKFSIYNKAIIGGDEQLGICRVPTDHILANEFIDRKIDIQPGKNGTPIRGQLHIRITFQTENRPDPDVIKSKQFLSSPILSSPDESEEEISASAYATEEEWLQAEKERKEARARRKAERATIRQKRAEDRAKKLTLSQLETAINNSSEGAVRKE